MFLEHKTVSDKASGPKSPVGDDKPVTKKKTKQKNCKS